MPKRKKSFHDDSSDDGRKRKKYDLSDQLSQLMESLRNYKTPTGKVLCEMFIRAPKRRSLADYYEVVSQPIDLLRIQQKIRLDEYDDLDQFSRDIQLLISNAKSYYKPDSVEYSDANQLWLVYLQLKDNIFGAGGSGLPPNDNEDRDEDVEDDGVEDDVDEDEVIKQEDESEANAESVNSESENDDSPYEELFSAVMVASANDSEGRQLSSMFELLPSKTEYPDYYQVVAEPIDLKMIASKIQNNQYNNLNELEKDLLLMIRNAKTYNATYSQIYKDANQLRKIIVSKKSEIDLRRNQPLKSSQRIRAKRQNPFQPKWSAITASLKYENDENAGGNVGGGNGAPASMSSINEDFDEETTNDDTTNFSDDNDDGEEEDDDGTGNGGGEQANSQWLLFNAVKDTAHSEAFMRLPSKRFYSDYYREIPHPISLIKIGTKIKNKLYENIAQLQQDLTLVFDNAMNYNRPDSKIYKDAAKLKKIMQLKYREIVSVFKENGDDEDEDEVEDVGYEEDQDIEQNVNRQRSTTNKNRASSVGAKSRRSSKSMVNAMSQELKNVRRSQKQLDSQLKKRMKALYKMLMDVNDGQGRFLIEPFLDKPSKKMYPDYYEIISNPIDMKTIEVKIKNELYLSEEALVSDFILMFSNCRKYNEDNSQIYQDADSLEAILNQKLSELGPLNVPVKVKKERTGPSSATQLKIKTLYEAVRDYTDTKGRLLSGIFQKLPSRAEFPDYYEVILKPICLEKIGQRVKNLIYDTVEDLLSDIILMLDNACKYNEPDSQIFKDALTLQQAALQAKIELNEDSVNGISDVKIIVQDLLANLFISVYNHQDEEGRCFSDSINELSELATNPNEPELKTLNFDIIKRNLNQGKYRRLDRFQQDMFEVFERARRISRTDSQAFEDSIELQFYFITLRNELCRNGEVMHSGALRFDANVLNTHVETIRREKVPKEINEEQSELKSEDIIASGGPHHQPQTGFQMTTLDHNGDEEMIVYQDVVYKVGDFVYVEARERHLEPHITYIEKFRKDEFGQISLYGCWFYRPHETFHLASKRFLENEVFKSDNYTSTPVNQIVGKCSVMFVKDYIRSKPIGVEERDVYVCESRYMSRGKTFKKIKLWPCLQNVPYVPRDLQPTMNRVPSVFKDQSSEKEITKSDDMDAELESEGDGLEQPNKILDVPRINVPCSPPEGAVPLIEGAQYYEQFTIPAGTFRVGDCCYVRTDQERNLICRIDVMWIDADGNPFFHGPWFVQQAELPPNTVGSFFPQEVFLSSIEDTNPLLSICERCSVLSVSDYSRKRPTEIFEKDVYVCEIRYLEHEKKFEPLPEGLRRFEPSGLFGVVEDEIYFFRNPLVLNKFPYNLPQVVDQMLDGVPQGVDPNSTMIQPGGQMEIDQHHNLQLQQHPQQQQIPMMHSGEHSLPIHHHQHLQQQLPQTPQSHLNSSIPVQHPTPQMAVNLPQQQQPQHLIQTPQTPQILAPPLTVPVATPTTSSAAAMQTPTASARATPSTSSKKRPSAKRLVTGYIIFASEVRRSVVEANPECSFGDISRLIGSQWKVLTPEQKNEFEQRAAKQNAEVKQKAAIEKARIQLLPPEEQPSTENLVYECKWENKCDFQFEDSADLFEHMTGDPKGHVWVSYADTKDKEPGEFQCMNHACGRVRKGALPFPTVTRLIRHCKEVHINKQVPKYVVPEKRSKNYVPGKKTLEAEAAAAAALKKQQAQMLLQQQQQQHSQQQGHIGPQQAAMMMAHQQQQQQVGPPGTYQLHQPITVNGQQLQGVTMVNQQMPPGSMIAQGQQGQQIVHHMPPPVPKAIPHVSGYANQILVVPNPNVSSVSSISSLYPALAQSITNSVPTTVVPRAQNTGPVSKSVQNPIRHSLHRFDDGGHGIGVQVKPVEPIFLGPPPRTNRLVHTHTYMKYIESLKQDRPAISNWEKQITAQAPPTSNNGTQQPASKQRQDLSRLPTGWLENGPGNNQSVVDALWALRNFMMKDALNLAP